MSDNSRIAWTDATWNVVTGCTPASAGCAHCYASTFARRGMGEWKGRPFSEVHCHEDRLANPLHWKKPRKVFVCSMGDLFHEAVPDEFVERVLSVIQTTPQHDYQLLTKRPDRMLAFMTRPVGAWTHSAHPLSLSWPYSNLWLGVSVEDQATADARIPLLLQTPAAVRFVSAEPMLGPVELSRYLASSKTIHVSADVDGMLRNRNFDALSGDDGRPLTRVEAEAELRALSARGAKRIRGSDECAGFSEQTGCPGHPNPRADWIIVGAESGPKRRRVAEDAIRSVVEQCRAAGTACFVKQIEVNGRVSHDPSEWPEDLRVREFPGGAQREGA